MLIFFDNHTCFAPVTKISRFTPSETIAINCEAVFQMQTMTANLVTICPIRPSITNYEKTKLGL